MGNGGESKVLNIELTQEKIKSIVNVTYSQPVSYFRKNIKLEMDILKPSREGKFPTVLFVTGGSFAHIYSKELKLQRLVMWLQAWNIELFLMEYFRKVWKM